MNLWKRIKNLWELSAYKMNGYPVTKDNAPVFIKSFPTIKKQLAKIIPNEEKTIYEILES